MLHTTVLEVWCKHLFKIFYMLQQVFSCCKLQVFYLDVADVSHTCCVYVPIVSSTSDVCCIQVFHVASIFMFLMYVQKVMGAWPGRREKGRGELGADGWGARRAWDLADGGVLVLISSLGFRPRGERGGDRGKKQWARGGARRTGMDARVQQQTAQHNRRG